LTTQGNKEEFESLFRECEQELFIYILGLTQNHSDALDVLQETAVRLWAHFDGYDRKRPFGAWARKFAHTEVLKAFEKGKYRKWMAQPFGVDAVAALAKEFEQHCEVLGLRKKALDQCLKKLEEPEIELLKQRYWMGTNMREVANKSGISEHKIYRRLSNIRQSLQECIDLVLANLAGQN